MSALSSVEALCTNVCFSPVSSGDSKTVHSSYAEIFLYEGTHADVVLLLKCKMLQNDYLMAHDSFIANKDKK